MSRYVRVNLIVEGHSEETFVRDVLAPSLDPHGVYLNARRVETSRTTAQIYRGGMTTYAKAKRDLISWLRQDTSAYLTTFFDFYRLPVDFPGMESISSFVTPYQKVAHLEATLAQDINVPRFIPYIQLHEFEGLLFSDVEAIDIVLRPYHSTQLSKLQEIRAGFETPELIDDGETTAPSKRLLTLYPRYNKRLFGPRIAGRIGLNRLCAECPHFATWLEKLENLK
jgi:hypothetical protein